MAGTSVSEFNRPSYKTACDINFKHVFLPKFGLWRTPATKSRQISFRFFGYHNVARTVVILNVSAISITEKIYLSPSISTLGPPQIGCDPD